MFKQHFFWCGMLIFWLAASLTAHSNTQITYQGRLDSGGQPYSGIAGMVFELYDQESGGTQQGPTLNRSVQVSDGLFQVELDFGAQAYEAGRWLTITVNGQLLSPRQRISGAAFALRVVPNDDCPTLDPSDEMVRVGGLCVDKYEASIWDAPVGGNQITEALPCSPTGQDCVGVIFARSVAGVMPRRYITWFQAQVALANSGKRLPTNAEWQIAATGTPDGTTCNVHTYSLAQTGAFPDCVSDWGAFDMVGNLWEWVADWVPASTTDCPGWGAFSDDTMCLAGANTAHIGPGALIRGGFYDNIGYGGGSAAGPFAVLGFWSPSSAPEHTGFRGVR